MSLAVDFGDFSFTSGYWTQIPRRTEITRTKLRNARLRQQCQEPNSNHVHGSSNGCTFFASNPFGTKRGGGPRLTRPNWKQITVIRGAIGVTRGPEIALLVSDERKK